MRKYNKQIFAVFYV